jgi:hypothetical protein
MNDVTLVAVGEFGDVQDRAGEVREAGIAHQGGYGASDALAEWWSLAQR